MVSFANTPTPATRVEQLVQNEATSLLADPNSATPWTNLIQRELGPSFVSQWGGTSPAAPATTAPISTSVASLFPQLAATQPAGSAFDIGNLLQSLGVSPQFAPQLAGLLAPAAEVGRDPELGTFNPITGEYDPRGGYDPETPIGFGDPNQAYWTNEMIDARLKQLERQKAYGEQPWFTKPSLMSAWDLITGASGMETVEEETARHEAEKAKREKLNTMGLLNEGPSGDWRDVPNPNTFAESGYALGPEDPQW